MAVYEPGDPAVTAADLLALNEDQLCQYLEKNKGSDGDFVALEIDGLFDLSDSQRDELAEKTIAAVTRLRCKAASQSLDTSELLKRLTNLVGEQDGSPKSTEISESRESTIPPPSDAEAQESSYHRLIESGGRAVCSLAEFLPCLEDSTGDYEKISPWLEEYSDPWTRQYSIHNVFTKQLDRWWEFRKSQWENRGVSDSDEGFAAYLESSRKNLIATGRASLTHRPGFEESIRRTWQFVPHGRQYRVSDHMFSSYRDAVKRRLRKIRFTRPLQLKKNPHQQTKWTNWLEYISYEHWRLDGKMAIAERLEEQTLEAWEKLLKARKSLSQGAAGPFGPPGLLGANAFDAAKDPETARAELHATTKMLNDFVEETDRYRQALAGVYHQRLLWNWTIKEAWQMDLELSQLRQLAKDNARTEAEQIRKRRRADNEEKTDRAPEPWSKRTRHGTRAKVAVPDSTKITRRRSPRLAYPRLK